MILYCVAQLPEEQRVTHRPTQKKKWEKSPPGAGGPASSPQHHHVLYCDYHKNCTELYRRIEKKDWDSVITFLDTGSFQPSSFTSCLAADRSNAKIQAKTVVTKFERNSYGSPTQIKWSRLPLHRAVVSGAPFAVIRRLVEVYPQAVRWANHHGQVALHLAMLFGASDEVVSFLVTVYPYETINKETKLGHTPLQEALRCETNKSRGVMLAVFVEHTKQPAAPSDPYYLRDSNINTKPMIPNKIYNSDNKSPTCIELYKRMEQQDANWDVIVEFLDTGSWRFTSLFHHWGGRDNVIPKQQARTWVTDRDPKTGKTLWSMLPLHCAIICGAPCAVTQRLLALYPRAVLYPDDQDMLPIHLALLHNADDELVAKLLLAYPDSVNKKSSSGLTPLDCALRAKDNVRGKFLEMFVMNSSSVGNPNNLTRSSSKTRIRSRLK